MADERRRFILGTQHKSGLVEQTAAAIFDLCSSFRGYGFAESHAWAFGQHAYTSGITTRLSTSLPS